MFKTTRSNRYNLVTAMFGHCIVKLTCIIVLCAIAAATNLTCAQQTDAPRPHQVKAAYLYNFTRYVQWPEHAEKPTSFVIGIIGDDPIRKSLEIVATTKKAGGRQIVIKRFESLESLERCDLLFITANASATVGLQAITATEGRPVLLVADASGMAASGAPISFYLDVNGTIGFEINVDAAQRRGLRMDAKLLKLASVVRDEK